MEKIQEEIEQHPKLGIRRKVEFKGIQYLDTELEEMQTIWLEKYLDTKGNEVPEIKPVERRYNVTNSNTVTAQGIPITEERVRKALNQKAGESDEDFEARIKKVYDNQIEQGTPQFDFWFNALISPTDIRSMLSFLRAEAKFDQK